MSLILDTHVFFWWITDDPRLGDRHRDAIAANRESVFVSAVSGWEIAVKVKLGKWPEASALVADWEWEVRGGGCRSLDLTLRQTEAAGLLDLVHKDPFDRLIAAQALELGWPVATVDAAFHLMGCRIL